jgi:hypothetical protein
MILLTAEEIPLTIVWNVFVDVATVLLLIIDEVASTPFTEDVNVFVAEDNTFVVVDTNPAIDVVDTTPLTLDVTTPPA